jgi:hypothetical protein
MDETSGDLEVEFETFCPAKNRRKKRKIFAPLPKSYQSTSKKA